MLKMKAVLEETTSLPKPERNNGTKLEMPRFLHDQIMMNKGKKKKKKKIGIVNMEEDDLSEWNTQLRETKTKVINIEFEQVSQMFKWDDLFPEWIDEEEESDVPTCPEIPMPDFKRYEKMDIIVAKLPCNYPDQGWGRDVFKLQMHLIVANLAVKKGKRDPKGKTKLAFWSKCRPMLELFRCTDLVRREDQWWFFEPEMTKLEQKMSLPVGSCKLALPLWGQGM